MANGDQAKKVKRAREFKKQPEYKYPLTGQQFGMRDRSRSVIDPESPTAKREWEINSRGGAYSDRIISKGPKGSPTKRA